MKPPDPTPKNIGATETVTGSKYRCANRQGLSDQLVQTIIRTLSVLATAILLMSCTVGWGQATKSKDRDDLIMIMGAIERGWETADGRLFRQHYLDFEGARYIEGGGQNEGLTDLVEHHVEPEGDALTDFQLEFSNIETHVEGDVAWAIADVELTATLNKDGRSIHNRGYQTFVFRRIGSGWKVVHTHSSSRPVKSD